MIRPLQQLALFTVFSLAIPLLGMEHDPLSNKIAQLSLTAARPAEGSPSGVGPSSSIATPPADTSNLPLNQQEQAAIETALKMLAGYKLTTQTLAAHGLIITQNQTKTIGTQTDPEEDIHIWTFFSKGKAEDVRDKDKSQSEKALIELINQEKTEIRAALYELNSYEIAYALCKAHVQRNVSIKIIMNMGTKRSIAQLLLLRCGVPIRYYHPTTNETREGGSDSILHTKLFIFEKNNGMAYLNTAKGITLPLNQSTAIMHTGSRNITGTGMNKNMEDSHFLAAPRSIQEANERFEKMWQATESQMTKDQTRSKTAQQTEKLACIEKTTGADIRLNDVPSENVVSLLQSPIIRTMEASNTPSCEFLTPAEIIAYQDFMPSNEQLANSEQPRIIPIGMILPGPSYLCVCNNKTYFKHRNTALNTLSGWFPTSLQDLIARQCIQQRFRELGKELW